MQIKKAVIPAAGFGTRFLPATKAIPKEMIPIIDKPTIQYVVEEAINAGVEEIILVLSSHKKTVEDYFKRNETLEEFLEKNGKTEELNLVKELSKFTKVKIAYQDEQKGLGHAVLCAQEEVGDDDFAVLLADDITISDTPVIKQLIESYNRTNATTVALREVSTEDIQKYGSIKYDYKFDDKTFKIDYMIEKPNPQTAPSNMAVLGRYVLTNKIFDILKKQKPGVNDEIQLTDAINSLIEFEDVYGYNFEGKRFDAGNPLGMLEATINVALSREELKEDFLTYLDEVIKEYKK